MKKIVYTNETRHFILGLNQIKMIDYLNQDKFNNIRHKMKIIELAVFENIGFFYFMVKEKQQMSDNGYIPLNVNKILNNLPLLNISRRQILELYLPILKEFKLVMYHTTYTKSINSNHLVKGLKFKIPDEHRWLFDNQKDYLDVFVERE